MTLFSLVAFNGLLLCAAVSDVTRYRIPNLLPALLALSGLVLAMPFSLDAALSRAASLGLVAVIATPLWLRGLLGGGDLKLLIGSALWIPLGGLATFAMALGLASGLQGVAVLACSHFAGRTPLATAARARVPYAVSIAAAGLVWSARAWLTAAS